MVISRINKSISYNENKTIDKSDLNHKGTAYDIEINGIDVTVVLGKEKKIKDTNVIFFPIYYVGKKNKFYQIGLYEIKENELSHYTDDENDLIIDELNPLFYSFVNELVERKNEKNPGNIEAEADVDENTWINNFFNNNNYDVMDIEGNGDCLFICIRDAFEQLGKMMTVKSIRELLSKQANETIYTNYKNMYEMFHESLENVDEEIREIMKKNDELKMRLVKESDRTSQKKIVDEAKVMKDKFVELKREKKQTNELLKDYKFMKNINNLETFKKVILTKKYWADSWAISTLERVFNIKIVPLSYDNFSKNNKENVLQSTELDPILEKNGVFNPDFYLVLEHYKNHYSLITYNGNRLFTIDNLPLEIKSLIIDTCVKNKGGSYSCITDFRF